LAKTISRLEELYLLAGGYGLSAASFLLLFFVEPVTFRSTLKLSSSTISSCLYWAYSSWFKTNVCILDGLSLFLVFTLG